MRKRAPGAGNARELKVARLLEGEGWLLGHRRHIPGPGDWLAVGPIPRRPMLIEVKSTSGGPYERFGPRDREALVLQAEFVDAEAWLYWWPPRRNLHRIPWIEFPEAQVERQVETIFEESE